MRGLNLPLNIYDWTKSFLTGRKQIVRVNSLESLVEPINRGIVQGSALGPFLFLLMISDLVPISSENCLIKYADDLTLLVPDDSDTSVKQEHDNIKGWAGDNKQTINEKKTKMSIFRKPRSRIKPVSGCQVEQFEQVDEFRLLGVVLDNRLTFVSHITSVLSSCAQRLYLLKLLRDQGMPVSCLHTIFVSLIVNKITYCISAWGGFINENFVSKINSLFRKAKKYGFTHTLYDYHGLRIYFDENLYHSMVFDNHCLNHLLTSSRQNIVKLRDRGHSFELPRYRTELYRSSFLPRILYNTM